MANRSLTRRMLAASVVAMLVVLVAVSASGQGATGRRMALVVGNDAYDGLPVLRNAVNDARSVASALREVGFTVATVENTTQLELQGALERFADELSSDDVALFYFAGHGVQVGGRNYLIPTDFAGSETGLELGVLKAVTVQNVLRRARVTILVLDACRNNPYRGVRGVAGLASMEPRGTLIAYAAGAGQVAEDSRPGASNGLFTAKFVEALQVPGLNATDLFRRVRREVSSASNDRQRPAVYEDLDYDFVFRPGLEEEEETRADPPRPDPRAQGLRAGDIFEDCDECPEMVVIPGGEFRMGSPSSEEERDNEWPRHSVRVGRFALGLHEVTRGEYAAFVAATGRESVGCFGLDGQYDEQSWRWPGFPQTDDHPVVCVSWEDARAYVRWLSREFEAAYRLPSESEWEYAARGRTGTSRYWGSSSSAQCEHANGADRTARQYFGWSGAASCYDGYAHTAPVGSFTANKLGLFDVLGNVSEWVADCYQGNYRGAPTNGSAWRGSWGCRGRVVRGGSWFSDPRNLRSAVRDRLDAGVRDGAVGFRVARTLDPRRRVSARRVDRR